LHIVGTSAADDLEEFIRRGALWPPAELRALLDGLGHDVLGTGLEPPPAGEAVG
jgi:hypothetical protein